MKDLIEIRLNPKRILRILVFISIGLILAHFVTQLSRLFFDEDPYNIISLFDLDKEANLPTLFSTLLLFFCSILLALIGAAYKIHQKSGFYRWQTLGIIFLFLAIDESAHIHERLIWPLQTAWNTSGFFYSAWVIPYGIATILFAILFIRFIFRLPRRVRWLFILGGAIYVMGAIGVEMVAASRSVAFGGDAIYILLTTIEEILEITGALIIFYALLSHLVTEFPNFVLSTRPPSD